MPVKRPGNTNKVTKPSSNSSARRGSRHSSLSSTAQEHLEQFAQQANSNVGHDAQDLGGGADSAIESPHELNAASILSNGSIASFHPALDSALGAEASFPMDLTTDEEPTRTAADVAHAAYGNLVKIDSALCKKLAAEPARRDPTQRRQDQRLNIERRSNVEALLAQVTGELAPRPCKNCHKGHGPWTQCVVYDGQMCGSCSNCWFNASGSRCTFHENNHPQPQIFAPAVAAPPPPLMAYQPTPIPQPPPAPVNLPPLVADVSHWEMSDSARTIVTKALGEVNGYGRGKRLATRVELAAKELAMRVAEFDEYCRTPEGIAEIRREQLQAQAADTSMDDDPSHEGPVS